MIDTVMFLGGNSYIRSNVRAKARLEIRNGFTVAVQDYTNPVTTVSNGWAGVLINLGLSSKPPPMYNDWLRRPREASVILPRVTATDYTAALWRKELLAELIMVILKVKSNHVLSNWPLFRLPASVQHKKATRRKDKSMTFVFSFFWWTGELTSSLILMETG